MPKFEFDEATHRYTLDGRRLVSVTQALSLVDDRKINSSWYLDRGRLVHLATQYYDMDILDESTVDPEIRPYLDAYVKFREETGFKPGFIEFPLHHPQYFYAGKIDRTGDLNGNHIILDLKSGAKARVDELQGVAYWELARVNDIPAKKAFDLYLKDDGGYSLVEIEKPKLLVPTFLAALTLTIWREGL